MSSKRKSDKYKHGIEITETADIVILRKKIHVPPIAVHVFWDPAVKRFTLWVHRYQILISCCQIARISNTQNRQSTHCFCFDILTKANTRDWKYYQSHTQLFFPYFTDHQDPQEQQFHNKIKGTRFIRLAPHPLSNLTSLDKQYWQELFKSYFYTPASVVLAFVLIYQRGCYGVTLV